MNNNQDNLSPAEFIEWANRNFYQLDSTGLNNPDPLTLINDEEILVLGDTLIDGGYSLPKLSHIYNLKLVKTFTSSGYTCNFYKKIDHSRPAYAIYTSNEYSSIISTY